MAHTLDDYTIAWICALPLEAAAARAMLDKTHILPERARDPNAYEFGELNGHHIVIAYLPNGIYGTVSAATVVSRMRLTFPRLQFGLMVGIGGGVPSKNHDIRLGDVVVSTPGGRHGGVIQYDYGKAVQGGHFEPTGMLNQPPQALLTHISQIRAKQMTTGDDVLSFIMSEALKRTPGIKERFSRPAQDTDLFFCASYRHDDKESDCGKCNRKQLVERQPPERKTSLIHYGLIASGDQVMKDSETRDRLAKQHGILCFEMEAAGLMNELPTLVIRGICDYCDSHKQKQWQGYAVLTAAAYAKLLVSELPISQVNSGSLVIRKAQYWLVPLFRNPNFVGRQDEIEKVKDLIMTQDGPTRIAITGLGGIGKTQVALEVAYHMREKDAERSVFWIPCTSRALIEATFLKIAETVGISDTKPTEIKKELKRYFSSQRAGKWLLILDNADDTEMWLAVDKVDPALNDFLPQSEQGKILFTTRNRKLASRLAPFNFVSIPNEDKSTAFQILQKLMSQEYLLQNDTPAAILLERLAFLPLAIVQASAYIIENGIELFDYLLLLQEKEQDAVELLSEDFNDPGRYKDMQNPVLATWLISFTQLRKQNQTAADYLSFIACINPRNIPRTLLPPQTTKKHTLDALGLLNAYSFTSSQNTNINLHRLVHLAIRNWLRKTKQFRTWIQRVSDQMQEVFPADHYTNRGLWREYLPHALALVGEDEFIEQRQNYSKLIRNIANCLARDGRFFEAEVQYKALLKVYEKKGLGHPDTLTSMADLASTYRQQGRWTEAEKLQSEVLEIRKALLGAEHLDTLTIMASLASTYRDSGRWTEAEKLEVQVLETRKTILGAEHPDTLTSINNLALTYRNQGRWTEAERLGIQVLKIRKVVLGTEHPATISSMNNLASIYWNQGRWTEAEKLQYQVVEIRKIVLGAEHPDTLTSINDLALTYCNQGRWIEAENLQAQMIETSKIILGAQHPDTLISMNNLALIYCNQGRWNEAENLQVQMMETSKTVLGAQHPDTLTSMNNLASIYRNQGRWNEAEELQVQVILMRKTILGAEHPDTLKSTNDLASIYWYQGRWNEAEKLQVQVIESSKIVLGAEHPVTLASMNNLVLTYRNQARWTEAENLQIQALDICKTILGPDHPFTITSINNLALTYRNQSRWNEAEKLQIQALEICKTILGPDHPFTLTSMNNLASILRNWGRWSEAEKLQLQVIEKSKIVLGAEHPDTLMNTANLAHIWNSQRRFSDASSLIKNCYQLCQKILGPDHPTTQEYRHTFNQWHNEHEILLVEND